MYKLIVTRNKEKVGEYVFEQGTVSIGRNSENDVRLEDQTVSGLHAKIISFFRPTYVQDQRSTNGTFVNGKRVQEHTLEPGDVITVGTHRLVYAPATGEARTGASQTTMILTDEDLTQLEDEEPRS